MFQYDTNSDHGVDVDDLDRAAVPFFVIAAVTFAAGVLGCVAWLLF